MSIQGSARYVARRAPRWCRASNAACARRRRKACPQPSGARPEGYASTRASRRWPGAVRPACAQLRNTWCRRWGFGGAAAGDDVAWSRLAGLVSSAQPYVKL